VHRRYLIVSPGRSPRALAVLCRYLVMVSRPLPAAALVVSQRYFIVAPGR
jgi:hypothetical protein